MAYKYVKVVGVKTGKFSPDGVNVILIEKGKEYELLEPWAKALLEMKAVRVKAERKAKPDGKH